MHQIVPRLHASAPLDLGFGRVPLQARAYLLERADGNVLIYGAHALGSDRSLREVTRQYLNHSHEASAADDGVDAPLFVHEADAAAVAQVATVAHTFATRHRVGDDLEVIPIPGHTAGATAYLWDSGEHRALFTGDSVFVRGGEWVAALLDGVSDRDTYLASLSVLAELDFDLLVPGVHPIGRPSHAFVEPGEGARRIAAIRERLARGEDQ